MKVCTKCGGEPKPLSEFNWNRSSGVRRSNCKVCQSKFAKDYRQTARGKLTGGRAMARYRLRLATTEAQRQRLTALVEQYTRELNRCQSA